MQIGFNRKAEQKPRPRTPFFSQANNTPPTMQPHRCRMTAAHEIALKIVLLLGEMNSNYFTGQFALRLNVLI
jgi:hypothetical protein